MPNQPPVVTSYRSCSGRVKLLTRTSQTPSPHRFLTGQRKSGTTWKDSARPASILREESAGNAPAEQAIPQQPARIKIHSQFAATPRFSVGRSSGTQTQRSPSPPRPNLIHALRTATRRHDDVEEEPASDGDDEMLDDEQYNAATTTEVPDLQWTEDVPYSPKRRKLNDFNEIPASFKRPLHPDPLARNPMPPFAQARPSSSAAQLDDAADHRRRAFIRPSVAPQESSGPLPETFSPHKRGHKFEPGGMAATVQQWVIQAGQAAVQSRKGQGYLNGVDYVMQVKLDEVIGNGPFTVLGRGADGVKRQLLLARRASADGEGTVVRAGEVVGVRMPTWDLELDGRIWTVAVDWRAL